MARRNPKTGTQPDLLEPEDTAIFVPLSELSHAQIRRLPVRAFTDDEWNSLSARTQEYILANDPESTMRRKELVRLIQAYVGHAINVDAQQAIRDHEHLLDDELRDASWVIERHRDELEATRQELFWHVEDDNEWKWAVESAFADSNNYDLALEEYYYEGCDVSVPVYDYLWIPLGGDYRNHNRLPDIEPVEVAFALANEAPEGFADFFDERDIERIADAISEDREEIDLQREPQYKLCLTVDLEKIEEAIKEELGEPDLDQLPEHPAPPPGSVLYTFDDGSYVQSLTPAELPNEGRKMGMCVGRPDMGYIEAVKDGEAAILSLRTAGGRPKFTIEVSLSDGKWASIEQVKGKANRFPGFPLYRSHEMVRRIASGDIKFKDDEFAKLIEFLASIGVRPQRVIDMGFGFDYIEKYPAKAPRSMAAMREFLPAGEPLKRSNPRGRRFRSFDEPFEPGRRRNPRRFRSFDEPFERPQR